MIVGPPGEGKSTLANEAGVRLWEWGTCPAGVFHVDLQSGSAVELAFDHQGANLLMFCWCPVHLVLQPLQPELCSAVCFSWCPRQPMHFDMASVF